MKKLIAIRFKQENSEAGMHHFASLSYATSEIRNSFPPGVHHGIFRSPTSLGLDRLSIPIYIRPPKYSINTHVDIVRCTAIRNEDGMIIGRTDNPRWLGGIELAIDQKGTKVVYSHDMEGYPMTSYDRLMFMLAFFNLLSIPLHE